MDKLLVVASRFLLLCSLLLAFPAIAIAQTITPELAQGPAGTSVTIKGTGWSPGDLIDFCWNFDCESTDTSVKADGNGTFTGTITVPQNAPIGDTYIDAGSQAKFITAQAPFTITTAATGTPTSPISIRSVYTTDENFTNKLVFKPGDRVYYHVDVVNTTNSPIPIYITFEAYPSDHHTSDPHLYRYDSGTLYFAQMPVGLSSFYNPVTLPSDVTNYVYAFAIIISQANNKSVIAGADRAFAIQTPNQSAPYQAGNYAGKLGIVGIGLVGSHNADPSTSPPHTYKEPDDSAHFNYCGPGASRVLISAWTANVPALETLACEEHTLAPAPKYDPNGTFARCMFEPINGHIGSTYYRTAQAKQQGIPNQADFSNMIGGDILINHHPLITGLLTYVAPTNHLNGWSGSKEVPHIVTVFGFDFSSQTEGYVFYYETGSKGAGTTAPELNVIDYNLFWVLVSNNNVQLTGTTIDNNGETPCPLPKIITTVPCP